MELKVLGSSSDGNCYLLKSATGKMLMIECGLTFKKIKKFINHNIKDLEGCIVSHSHKDHCSSISELSKLGVNVFANRHVMSNNIMLLPFELIHSETVSVGEFRVMPFDVEHDVPCVNFLIYHEECGTIAFITDTANVNYDFNHVDTFLIEANHSVKTLYQECENEALAYRITRDHMSLETAISIVNRHSNTNRVVLVHLSERNGHSDNFKSEMEKKTGIVTSIAEEGLELKLFKTL